MERRGSTTSVPSSVPTAGRSGRRACKSTAVCGHLRPSTAVYGRLGSQATGASRVCTGETATLAGQQASLANEQRTAVVAREGSGRPPARCWVPPGPALRATGNASDTTSLGFLPPRSGRGRGVEIELVPARSFSQLLVTRVERRNPIFVTRQADRYVQDAFVCEYGNSPRERCG
jgi:hypothetical protein